MIYNSIAPTFVGYTIYLLCAVSACVSKRSGLFLSLGSIAALERSP